MTIVKTPRGLKYAVCCLAVLVLTVVIAQIYLFFAPEALQEVVYVTVTVGERQIEFKCYRDKE